MLNYNYSFEKAKSDSQNRLASSSENSIVYPNQQAFQRQHSYSNSFKHARSNSVDLDHHFRAESAWSHSKKNSLETEESRYSLYKDNSQSTCPESPSSLCDCVSFFGEPKINLDDVTTQSEKYIRTRKGSYNYITLASPIQTKKVSQLERLSEYNKTGDRVYSSPKRGSENLQLWSLSYTCQSLAEENLYNLDKSETITHPISLQEILKDVSANQSFKVNKGENNSESDSDSEVSSLQTHSKEGTLPDSSETLLRKYESGNSPNDSVSNSESLKAQRRSNLSSLIKVILQKPKKRLEGCKEYINNSNKFPSS